MTEGERFVADFRKRNPSFYARILASEAFEGDAARLLEWAEDDGDGHGDPMRWARFFLAAAEAFEQDALAALKPEPPLTPSLITMRLLRVADDLEKVTWTTDDLRGLDEERHKLGERVAKLNETLGYRSPRGRKRKNVDLERARHLLALKVPHVRVARELGVSRNTLYKLLAAAKLPD